MRLPAALHLRPLTDGQAPRRGARFASMSGPPGGVGKVGRSVVASYSLRQAGLRAASDPSPSRRENSATRAVLEPTARARTRLRHRSALLLEASTLLRR